MRSSHPTRALPCVHRLARSAILTHVLTKQLERYLALHSYAQRAGFHCSRAYKLKCASYCATRADGGGRELGASDGGGKGERGFKLRRDFKKREWCKHAAPGHVADEWCTVQSVAPPADAAGRCCGLGANASCTSVFGSNSWPVPFRKRGVSEMKRFERVPSSVERLGREVWNASRRL